MKLNKTMSKNTCPQNVRFPFWRPLRHQGKCFAPHNKWCSRCSLVDRKYIKDVTWQRYKSRMWSHACFWEVDIFRKVGRIRELHMPWFHHNESECAWNILWTSLHWPIIRFGSTGQHLGFKSGPQVTRNYVKIRSSHLVTWTPEGPPAGATWRRVLRTIYG